MNNYIIIKVVLVMYKIKKILEKVFPPFSYLAQSYINCGQFSPVEHLKSSKKAFPKSQKLL